MIKKNIVLILSFFVIVSVILFAFNRGAALADESAVTASEWPVETLLLSVKNQKASIPSIAIDNANVLHVGFKQGSNPAYVTSSNGGSTWSSPQLIPTNANVTIVDKVDIAVDENGKVHATWVEASGSVPSVSYTLRYASKSGPNWGAAETIESSPFPIVLNQSSLAVRNGRVYLVWQKANSAIRFSSRSGAVWSSPTEILGTRTAKLPEIAADTNENLYIIYVKSGSTNSAQYVQSIDRGANWTGNIALSGSLDVKDVDLTLKGSHVHVTFGAIDLSSGATEARPYYADCVNNCSVTASWTSAAVVTDRDISDLPVDAPFYSTIAATGGNEILVFFHAAFGNNTSVEQVLGTCFQPGAQSGKDYNLPTNFTQRMVNPQIVYGDGAMHMVYERVVGQTDSASLREVHYARLDVNCYDIYLPIIFK